MEQENKKPEVVAIEDLIKEAGISIKQLSIDEKIVWVNKNTLYKILYSYISGHMYSPHQLIAMLPTLFDSEESGRDIWNTIQTYIGRKDHE